MLEDEKIARRNKAILQMMKKQTQRDLARPASELRAEIEARDAEAREGWLGISDWLIAQEHARSIACTIPDYARRAVLMAPFNSKGCGFRGGFLARWSEGNGHLRGQRPPLFIRTPGKGYSGDYRLTPLGEEVRRILMETDHG